MNPDLQKLLDFIEGQKVRQARHVPTVYHDKLLTFLGTTSQAGTRATMGICPIVALEEAGGGKELRVRLRGALPRMPRRGECVSVHVTNVSQYQGYQIKTRAVDPDSPSTAYELVAGDTLVKGAQIYTVHHSPYTLKFFEQIPFEEVQQLVGGVRFALVAIGEGANISPRFVFHHEEQGGRLVLYHGDGLALKTYANLKANRQETRLLLDLDDFSGYALQGTLEEFQPQQHPVAYERICLGFTSGNWGKPSRVFRFVADAFTRIAPSGPAVKPA